MSNYHLRNLSHIQQEREYHIQSINLLNISELLKHFACDVGNKYVLRKFK